MMSEAKCLHSRSKPQLYATQDSVARTIGARGVSDPVEGVGAVIGCMPLKLKRHAAVGLSRNPLRIRGHCRLRFGFADDRRAWIREFDVP